MIICATCYIAMPISVECPACSELNCLRHAAAHMEKHISDARLFLAASDAVEQGKKEVLDAGPKA